MPEALDSSSRRTSPSWPSRPRPIALSAPQVELSPKWFSSYHSSRSCSPLACSCSPFGCGLAPRSRQAQLVSRTHSSSSHWPRREFVVGLDPRSWSRLRCIARAAHARCAAATAGDCTAGGRRATPTAELAASRTRASRRAADQLDLIDSEMQRRSRLQAGTAYRCLSRFRNC